MNISASFGSIPLIGTPKWSTGSVFGSSIAITSTNLLRGVASVLSSIFSFEIYISCCIIKIKIIILTITHCSRLRIQ